LNADNRYSGPGRVFGANRGTIAIELNHSGRFQSLIERDTTTFERNNAILTWSATGPPFWYVTFLFL
jgi:hypothetical protein